MDNVKVYEITPLIPSCHFHESGNPVLLTNSLDSSFRRNDKGKDFDVALKIVNGLR
jgi:hypothetical protein